jgi:hypothetical protein
VITATNIQVFFRVALCPWAITMPRPRKLEYSATPLSKPQIPHSKKLVGPTNDWKLLFSVELFHTG